MICEDGSSDIFRNFKKNGKKNLWNNGIFKFLRKKADLGWIIFFFNTKRCL